jgi:hypothetical protein
MNGSSTSGPSTYTTSTNAKNRGSRSKGGCPGLFPAMTARQISMQHTYAKLFRYAGKNYVVCCGVWHDGQTHFVPRTAPHNAPQTVPLTESVDYVY